MLSLENKAVRGPEPHRYHRNEAILLYRARRHLKGLAYVLVPMIVIPQKPNPARALSPDGKTVIVGRTDGTAQFLDRVSGQPRGELIRHIQDTDIAAPGQEDRAEHIPYGDIVRRRSVHAVAFSPDGKSVATGGGDGCIRLWNVGTGRPIGPIMGMSSQIRSVAFSPDGKLLLARDGDLKARLWNVADRDSLPQPDIFEIPLWDAFFSLDGRLIITLTQEGIVRLWDMTGRSVVGSALFGRDDIQEIALGGGGTERRCSRGTASVRPRHGRSRRP